MAWPAAVAHRLYLRRLQRKAKKKQRFINRCVVTSMARDYNIPIETWCVYRCKNILESCLMFKFSVALRLQRTYGLLGTGRSGRPPPPSRCSWALNVFIVQCCFTSTENIQTMRDGSSGRPPRPSPSSWPLNASCVHRSQKHKSRRSVAAGFIIPVALACLIPRVSKITGRPG